MFDEEYWYKRQQKKFMHNIDTFYFSVKLQDDFTESSESNNVKNVRKVIRKYSRCSDSVPFTEVFFDSAVLYRKGSFGTKHMTYDFRLEVPEQFDFFFASKVPESSESVCLHRRRHTGGSQGRRLCHPRGRLQGHGRLGKRERPVQRPGKRSDPLDRRRLCEVRGA